MVLHHLQPSLAGGEISPSLYARVDTTDYTTCVKTAENMIVHPQGGISNRAGTRFRAVSKNGQACRIVPFIVSEEEVYVVEIGNGYVRFHTQSGLVLTDSQQPYELVTPYTNDTWKNVSFTHYNGRLYFTHPSFAPRCLTRISEGRFSWEEVPLKYGPFKLANTDSARHLRVYQTQDSIVSDGEAATLAFQPIAYPEYVVWAYFNNEWFYAAADYGLDVADLAAAFNEHYASRGLQAVSNGGVLRITSPAATGGDWNGVSLALQYRRVIDQAPELTVVQTLEGGTNSGTVVPQGDTRYVLESDFDCFSASHVGGKFLLLHHVDSQYQSGVLGYESTSAVIKSGGDWSLRTSGSWTGQLVVEASADAGTTWKTVKILSRQSGDENFSLLGDLNDDENLFLIRVRSAQISGEVGYELQAEAFAQEGVISVTNYVSARQVIVEIERALGGEDWTENWREGSFSPAAGYPRCVFFFQNRLGFASTQDEPQTLWFSKTGKYTDFGHARHTIKDSDSISIHLSGKQLTAIRSVLVTNRLLVFSAGSEWSVFSNGSFTPSSVQAEQHSELGSFSAEPLLAGNKVIFVQARGSVLRNFYYDYTTASYDSVDLTVRARHLFLNRTVREICYQQEPDKLVWCVLDDGTLLSLTYEDKQGVYAWAHHRTQGDFQSVCTVPRAGYDEVWCVVKRGTNYMLESFVKRLETKTPQSQWFSDCAVCVKKETPFTQVDGLSHLEGKEVAVLADGNPVYGLTVHDGKIQLPQAVSQVIAGLAYESKLETLPVYFTRSDGSSLDRKKRLVAVTFKLLDSRGGFVGTENGPLTELLPPRPANWNTPVALYSGDFKTVLAGTHTYMPAVLLKQTAPLPITVLAYICQVV